MPNYVQAGRHVINHDHVAKIEDQSHGDRQSIKIHFAAPIAPEVLTGDDALEFLDSVGKIQRSAARGTPATVADSPSPVSPPPASPPTSATPPAA